jgi:hypothetical protein
MSDIRRQTDHLGWEDDQSLRAAGYAERVYVRDLVRPWAHHQDNSCVGRPERGAPGSRHELIYRIDSLARRYLRLSHEIAFMDDGSARERMGRLKQRLERAVIDRKFPYYRGSVLPLVLERAEQIINPSDCLS